jgi:hypothetical protein
MLVVTVSPSIGPDGRQAYSGRGQLFDGAVDGRVLVTRSTQPLLDGCRVLIGEGIDPAIRIVMPGVVPSGGSPVMLKIRGIWWPAATWYRARKPRRGVYRRRKS